MRNNKFFVYVINNRVLWMSETIFHIPVLNELYQVYSIKNRPDIELSDCIQYIVKSFHNFSQDDIILSPPDTKETEEVLPLYEKIKIYVRLCDYINYSYLSALPPVFSSEEDQLEILARSLLNEKLTEPSIYQKHTQFVDRLVSDKKIELKNKFIEIVHVLKKASTLQEVQQIGYEVVFNGINVV